VNGRPACAGHHLECTGDTSSPEFQQFKSATEAAYAEAMGDGASVSVEVWKGTALCTWACLYLVNNQSCTKGSAQVCIKVLGGHECIVCCDTGIQTHVFAKSAYAPGGYACQKGSAHGRCLHSSLARARCMRASCCAHVDAAGHLWCRSGASTRFHPCLTWGTCCSVACGFAFGVSADVWEFPPCTTAWSASCC